MKKIAFIGNMMPLVKTLKENGNFEFYIFERNPKHITNETITGSFEYSLLPKMDAVLISGTSLLNGSLDMILDRAKNARLKILVGPTAQILPEFIGDYEIDYIASVRTTDIDKTLINLKFGSSFGLFKKYSKKYVVKV
ncbi:Rossmann-like domain-containing protein [Methanotorris formicicus]